MIKAPTPIYFEDQGNFFFPHGHPSASMWKRGRLGVLRSVSTLEDGTKWLHVSVSLPDRHPTWEEMVLVKEQFIGADLEAVMVLPPRRHHVNIQAHCFHWWARVSGEGSALPGLHKITWEDSI